MAIAKVGVSGTTYLATTGASAGMTGAYGQSPTAGNLLVMGVTMSAALATATSCTTPSGWTAGPVGIPSGGADYKGAIYTFWRVAAGGDAGPAVTVAGGTYGTAAVTEQWSGLTTPVVDTTLVVTKNTSSATAGGDLTGAQTTTGASDLLWSAFASMDAGGVGLTWVLQSVGTSFRQADYVREDTASRLVGPGTYTVGPTWTSPSLYGASHVNIAFKTGSGGGTSQGTASGHTTFTGTATGTTTRRGAAAGVVLFTGLALGAALHAGATTGHTTWAGSANGVTPAVSTKAGSAAGTTTWTGAAFGVAPTVGAKAGSATGHTSWVGVAAGTRTSRGTATGSSIWAGHAAGLAPVVGGKYGAASGATLWTGTAAGRRDPVGATTGTWTWTGTAAGTTTRQGATTGAWAFTGHATGHPGAPALAPTIRHPTLTLTLPAPALTLTLPDTHLELL